MRRGSRNQKRTGRAEWGNERSRVSCQRTGIPHGTRLRRAGQPHGSQPHGSQPHGSQPHGSQPNGSQSNGSQYSFDRPKRGIFQASWSVPSRWLNLASNPRTSRHVSGVNACLFGLVCDSGSVAAVPQSLIEPNFWSWGLRQSPSSHWLRGAPVFHPARV